MDLATYLQRFYAQRFVITAIKHDIRKSPSLMRTSINGFKWIEILLLHFRGPRADNKHDDCSPSSFFFYHHFRTPGLNSANKSSPPQLRGKWPQCCVHWCGGFTLAARQAICLTIEELSRFLICWLVQIYAEDFTKLLIINFYYVSHTRRQGSPVKHWKIAMPSFSFTWPAIMRNTPRNRWQFPPLDSLDD